MKAVCMTNVLVTEMVFVYDKTYAFYLDTASDIRITGCNIYWAFPQLTQAGGDIKEKNTIRVKINKK